MKSYTIYILAVATFFSCDTQRQKQGETTSKITIENSVSAELGARKWKRTSLKDLTVFDFETTLDNRILAATSEGLYMSRDGGNVWEHISNNFLTNLQVNCLGKSDSVIYAGVGGNGIYKSDDSGLSWYPSNYGITPSNKIIVKDILVKNKIVYAATSGGLFVSFNKGESWRTANQGFPIIKTEDSIRRVTSVSNIFDDGEKIIVLTEQGVALTENEGNSWTLPNHEGLTDKNMISTVAGKGNIVFAGKFLKDGLYYSLNNGDTWQKSGLAGYNLNKVFLSPSGIIYAGTVGKGLFRSVNKGKDWVEFNNGLPKESTISSFIVTDTGDMLLGTENKGIYKLMM